jgi:hypothetical protein
MVRQQASVWTYVTRTPPPSGSGNPLGKCLFCPKQATQHAAAWWPHLRDCAGSSTLTQRQQRALAEAKVTAKAQLDAAAAAASKKQAQLAATAAAQAAAAEAGDGDSEGEGGLAGTTLGRAFANTAAAKADAAVARCFFANALPLRIVDDKYFREMCTALRDTSSSYLPPPRQKLSANKGLLQQEVKSLKRKQDQLIQQDKDKYGLTIVSDGFTDAASRPLINVVLLSPKGEYFVEAVDTSGNKKTMAYVAEQVRVEVVNLCACSNLKAIESRTACCYGYGAHVYRILVSSCHTVAA